MMQIYSLVFNVDVDNLFYDVELLFECAFL